MNRIVRVIVDETVRLIPPMIYFFIAFSLLLVTQALISQDYGLNTLDLGTAAVGALIVGKILLVVDSFSFVDRFPDKPLIYNAVWKTVIYNIAALAIRYLEAIVPLWIDKGDFGQANEAMFAALNWAHFWLVQLWLAVLFLVYCSARELVRKIGAKTVRAMFLGA